MRGKIQTNWSVGYGRRDVWREEGKATKINPICRCSQHRCWLRGCRPPRMYEYRPCLYFDVALFHSWLQGITSKSVKKSENSPLNPGDCEWAEGSCLYQFVGGRHSCCLLFCNLIWGLDCCISFSLHLPKHVVIIRYNYFDKGLAVISTENTRWFP